MADELARLADLKAQGVLASVLDFGSRRLLGYSMADHMRTEVVLDALGMAVAARAGAVAGVIGHADRGSQPSTARTTTSTTARTVRCAPRPGSRPDSQSSGLSQRARPVSMAVRARAPPPFGTLGERAPRTCPDGWLVTDWSRKTRNRAIQGIASVMLRRFL